MRRTILQFLAVVGATVLATTAHADVTLNAVRLGAVDVEALARFYQTAFGLREVNRLQFPGMLEIMMNFGESVEAAKANTNAQVVIMSRKSDSVDDPVPHIIFNVTDMTATTAAVKAAGGKMDGEPRPFGDTGIVIAFFVDPAGNRGELIQWPKR
jgi:predicted enzyme related to lactoylglutathione lyase